MLADSAVAVHPEDPRYKVITRREKGEGRERRGETRERRERGREGRKKRERRGREERKKRERREKEGRGRGREERKKGGCAFEDLRPCLPIAVAVHWYTVITLEKGERRKIEGREKEERRKREGRGAHFYYN